MKKEDYFSDIPRRRVPLDEELLTQLEGSKVEGISHLEATSSDTRE